MKTARSMLGGVAVVLCLAAAPALADEAKNYVDYQRQVLAKDRKATVTANLKLTPAEEAKFWPLYDEYHAELNKLGDRIYKLIFDYAQAYNADKVTDAQGAKWVQQALDYRRGREELRGKYMTRFEKVLPGKKLARYYQLETKLDSMIDAKITSEIPLVE